MKFSKNDRDTLGKIITLTALYYQKELERQIIVMYINDLEAWMTADEAVSAYTIYRKNPKNRTFPLPAQIIEIARPSLTLENQAIEAVGRIVQAIVDFGYSNGSEAQKFIGELGWQVVKRNGGWASVCKAYGTDYDKSSFVAQARALALVSQERARLGQLDQAPSMPIAASAEILKLVSIKNIPEAK